MGSAQDAVAAEVLLQAARELLRWCGCQVGDYSYQHPGGMKGELFPAGLGKPLGSLVKLPWALHRASGQHSTFLNAEGHALEGVPVTSFIPGDILAEVSSRPTVTAAPHPRPSRSTGSSRTRMNREEVDQWINPRPRLTVNWKKNRPELWAYLTDGELGRFPSRSEAETSMVMSLVWHGYQVAEVRAQFERWMPLRYRDEGWRRHEWLTDLLSRAISYSPAWAPPTLSIGNEYLIHREPAKRLDREKVLYLVRGQSKADLRREITELLDCSVDGADNIIDDYIRTRVIQRWQDPHDGRQHRMVLDRAKAERAITLLARRFRSRRPWLLNPPTKKQVIKQRTAHLKVLEAEGLEPDNLFHSLIDPPPIFEGDPPEGWDQALLPSGTTGSAE